MGAVAPSNVREVLVCRCDQAGLVPKARRKAIVGRLRDQGCRIVEVGDLCGAAAVCEESLVRLSRAERLSVVACHPRAVRWLFEAAGAPLDPARTELINVRSEVSAPAEVQGAGWVPWFPVIDRDRCQGCRQCASFCLFGVYEVLEGDRVEVLRPEACKTNCPACARICPHAAIVFPKLGEEPLNGAEVTDESAVQAAVQVNVDRLLGSDPIAALAERQAKARRRLLRRRAIEQAEAERGRCTCQDRDGCSEAAVLSNGARSKDAGASSEAGR